tara:strand:- start:753 stop:1025 length:273 start_codon:yes stop_codon:yes gene_type:complete
MGSTKKFRITVFKVMEKTPRIITVMTKKDSSGSTGERRGSAVVPNDVRMDGVMIKTVMSNMNMSIMNMEPPGGGGGGGDEPLAMVKRQQR